MLKLDKSNDSNDEHEKNMLFIIVTFDVSKLERFKDVNNENLKKV